MVPAIRQGALGDPQTCFVAEMFPGAHPIEELEQALVRIGTHSASRLHDLLDRELAEGSSKRWTSCCPSPAKLVLVVDQFEEVFTLTADERERELFLESLRVAALDPESRLRVVVTLRADFYDRPLDVPAVRASCSRRGPRRFPRSRPTSSNRRSDDRPRGSASRAEPGLVAEIIADVAAPAGRAAAAAVRAHRAVRATRRRSAHARGLPGDRRRRGRLVRTGGPHLRDDRTRRSASDPTGVPAARHHRGRPPGHAASRRARVSSMRSTSIPSSSRW